MKQTFCITFFILFFANSVTSQTETLKLLLEKTNELNLDMWDLTTYAEENLKDKEALAKFFYYWISSNIHYDEETFSKSISGELSNEQFWELQDEYVVYENRKGVCAGYASLYKWFMDELEIEAVIITGHIRDPRNPYVNLNDDNFRHGWNGVKLNDEWILVDTTWGNSNDPTQSEYYFNINPEWLIITHYPEQNKWQLLEKPLTLEKFNNSKYIKPVWFHLGFDAVPKLMADEEYYYFVYKKPDTNWSVNLQYSSDNINFEHIRGIEPIAQDGMMYYRFKKEQITQKAFLKVGLTLLIEEEDGYSTIQHKDVINFKIEK